jgi:hypothetical protein
LLGKEEVPMRKSIASALLVLTFAAFAAGAQAPAPPKPVALPITSTDPAVDGVVGKGEYSTTVQAGKMQVWVARTADTLYAAVTAPTTGWVGLGFGSGKMDGATIVMAYVTGTQAQVKLQRGTGFTHADLNAPALLRSAAQEADGKTTLEFALKTDGIIAQGQKDLGGVASWGATDDFVSYHRERSPLAFTLQ